MAEELARGAPRGHLFTYARAAAVAAMAEERGGSDRKRGRVRPDAPGGSARAGKRRRRQQHRVELDGSDACGRRRLDLTGGRAICALPFLAPEACREFVALCEAHAVELGGWSKELAVRYPQTTTDLEVDRVPALRHWLIEAEVMPRVRAHFAAAHGAELHALDDLFVIKYDARTGGEQTDLQPHRDAGDISFMVALSARCDYTGGGTHYPELDKVVHLDQGELLSFDADLVHSGVPISSGVRYLLVGFCHCASAAAATEPGNIRCDTLDMIAHNTPDVACGEHIVVSEPVAVVRQQALGTAAISILQADALKLHAIAAKDDVASYWVDATATPRCSIEQFALEVLAMHIPTAAGTVDSGAEFWVQRLDRRQFRERRRKGSHEERGEDSETNLTAADHLPFHFDKDEAALRNSGVWSHPACSTVSYLSSVQCGDLPTVVFDSVQQEQVEQGHESTAVQPRQACISYPSAGKHLAFRGKYLHGCPLELAYSQRQTQRHQEMNGSDKATECGRDYDCSHGATDEAHERIDDDAVGRLTLLVNLWTKGTRPTSLQPLPAAVVARLSKCSTLAGKRTLLRPGHLEQLRVVVANSRQRGGVGPAVSLFEHVEGMTAPLPVAAIASAQAESSCLCVFM